MAKYIPKFYGQKGESGEFEHAHPDDFARHMELFEVGDELELTVKKRSKRRTQGAPGEGTNQNGYLWGVLIRSIADEIGELDQDVVYAWVLVAVGHFKVMPDGTKIALGTSDLEAGPFQELCKRIQIWAATPGNVCEKGLYLPDPHEAEYNV